MRRLSYILAVFWGVFWAMILQWTQFGRWLALKRTWITVVVGVGVDLLLALPVLPFAYWWRLLVLIGCSAVGIVARSLLNELGEERDVIRAARGR